MVRLAVVARVRTSADILVVDYSPEGAPGKHSKGIQSLGEQDKILRFLRLLLVKSRHMHSLFQIADELSRQVTGAAIEVHRRKGPGLIESIYERCLMRELELRLAEEVVTRWGDRSP